MFFIRFLVICVSVALTISVSGSFAASGSLSGSGNTSIKVKNIEKESKDDESSGSINTDEKKIEDKKTEKNAQKIILEVYKIQGNKILKDMDINIEKMNPDPKVRIEVYSSIQKTLEFRKQKLEKSELSDDSKDILTGYISYMISSIEKKKKNLE